MSVILNSGKRVIEPGERRAALIYCPSGREDGLSCDRKFAVAGKTLEIENKGTRL